MYGRFQFVVVLHPLLNNPLVIGWHDFDKLAGRIGPVVQHPLGHKRLPAFRTRILSSAGEGRGGLHTAWSDVVRLIAKSFKAFYDTSLLKNHFARVVARAVGETGQRSGRIEA